MVFGGCDPLEEVDILVVVVVGGCDPLDEEVDIFVVVVVGGCDPVEQVDIFPQYLDAGCHLGTRRCGRGS